MSSTKWTRRDVLSAASAAVTLSVAHAAPQEASAAKRRLNLVLFMPDELRADALACYGNPLVKTPHFDHLASSGARFVNCHVQFPVCAASRCSMATGWPTSVRGHRSLYYFLQPDEPNMFRYLRQAGYDVYMFGKNDVLAHETLADSLTEWRNPRPPSEEFAAIDKPQHPTTMLLPPGGEPRGTGDYAALQLARRILERRENERPFCIFLALFETSDDKYFIAAYKIYFNLIWLNGEVGTGAGDVAGGADFGPTDTSRNLTEMIEKDLAAARTEYRSLLDKDVPAFNRSLAANGVTPLSANNE